LKVDLTFGFITWLSYGERFGRVSWPIESGFIANIVNIEGQNSGGFLLWWKFRGAFSRFSDLIEDHHAFCTSPGFRKRFGSFEEKFQSTVSSSWLFAVMPVTGR
jgi:hypothetical protein